MANGDYLPDTFVPMGAEFVKPYMEFEFEGQIHRLENLAGGHNGRVAAACQASPPQFDSEKNRWVVKIENNLIDIDLGNQPAVAAAIPESKSFLRSMSIINNPRRSFVSTGLLVSASASPDERPRFPVDCTFEMHIRVNVPGKPSLINVKPFQLSARNIDQWPPPVGTVYRHDDAIELYPEWVPFSEFLMKPVVRILPGDETIITDVFETRPEELNRPNLLKTLINRLT